ncbi:MAG: hypothetical protein E6R03_11635 [Hyphomicrobiaceae bacterium]|nr:MAG: hypothetical protein E6R03_11635 [Hyphomicrobiaceae bacterium]
MALASLREIAGQLALQAEITILKRRARTHLGGFNLAAGGMDCGNHLAKEISQSASHHAEQFNKAMEHLEQLDPTCPKGYRL